MNRDTKFQRLTQFPEMLARIVNDAGGLLTQRPADGTFALVEHVCHLADLEEEGYGRRIMRLLSETSPFLADFAGDVIARERRYLEQHALPALERFRKARRLNILTLRSLRDDQWGRKGSQENVGAITLASIFDGIVDHDTAHAAEIAALLRELGARVPDELALFIEHEPLARSA
jgi:hypothetical protein